MGNEVDIILDYGNELHTVEVKSAETISSDFFKGLRFYHALAGDKNTKRFIVYAGTNHYTMHGVHIVSYRDLAQLDA